VLRVLRAHESAIRALGVSRLRMLGGVARAEAGPDSEVDLVDLQDDLEGPARAGALRLRRQAPAMAPRGDPRRGDPGLPMPRRAAFAGRFLRQQGSSTVSSREWIDRP
jgi:hypothetical protein